MLSMPEINEISFHESTVVSFKKVADDVRLDLIEVNVLGTLMSANICIEHADKIFIDDEPAGTVEMVFDDGEVLSLDISSDDLKLLVEWNDFKNNCAILKSYYIHGKNAAVTLDKKSFH